MGIYLLQLVVLVTVLNSYLSASTTSCPDDPQPEAGCKGENMLLKCKKHKRLVIKDTFYGRKDDATCKNKKLDEEKTCDEETPEHLKRKIHNMCQGKTRCKVPVTTKFIKKHGSKCPSKHKYLVVTYACQQHPNKKSGMFLPAAAALKQARLAQPGGGSAYNFASPDYVEPESARINCNSILAGSNIKIPGVPGYHSQG